MKNINDLERSFFHHSLLAVQHERLPRKLSLRQPIMTDNNNNNTSTTNNKTNRTTTINDNSNKNSKNNSSNSNNNLASSMNNNNNNNSTIYNISSSSSNTNNTSFGNCIDNNSNSNNKQASFAIPVNNFTNNSYYTNDVEMLRVAQLGRPTSLQLPTTTTTTTTTGMNHSNPLPSLNVQKETKVVPMKIETPSSPPITPLSKKSAGYSIEALLKHTTTTSTNPNDNYNVTNDGSKGKTVSPPSLTPPQSPEHKHLSDMKYNEQIQQSLHRILETAISRMYLTPAFRLLDDELKCKLLEKCWFHLFLLGVFEVNFPLDSLNLYTQNMVKLNPNQADLFALNKMDFGLRKLFEHNIDDTELAFLKDMVVFQPGKGDFLNF